MDWTIIVPTAITGVVGLAGIGGTLLSARMTSKSDAENLRTSISAEDARAKLAEKRRAYAAFHASLDNVFAIAATSNPRPTADMLSDLDAALRNTVINTSHCDATSAGKISIGTHK